MPDGRKLNVVPFSKNGSHGSMRCIPLKIRGEVTFTKPNPRSQTRTRPLLALCAEQELPQSLLMRLTRLDAEQLQIVELIAKAMERGVL